MLFRGAKSLRVSDCDLASGVADVMINMVFLQAALSLLLLSVSPACKTEPSPLLSSIAFLSVSQVYVKIQLHARKVSEG